MIIHCPISIGEFLDKISILRIKVRKIKSEEKLKKVKAELEQLETQLKSLNDWTMEVYIKRLEEINEHLWGLEDSIRLKEKHEDFNSDFISLARDIYFANDERFYIKNEANEKFGSEVVEQKEYNVIL